MTFFVRVAIVFVYLCRSAVINCMLCNGDRGIGCVVVVVVMLVWY